MKGTNKCWRTECLHNGVGRHGKQVCNSLLFWRHRVGGPGPPRGCGGDVRMMHPVNTTWWFPQVQPIPLWYDPPTNLRYDPPTNLRYDSPSPCGHPGCKVRDFVPYLPDPRCICDGRPLLLYIPPGSHIHCPVHGTVLHGSPIIW